MSLAGNEVPEEQTTPCLPYNLKIDSTFRRNTDTDLPDGIMETILFFCLPSALSPNSNKIITKLRLNNFHVAYYYGFIIIYFSSNRPIRLLT